MGRREEKEGGEVHSTFTAIFLTHKKPHMKKKGRGGGGRYSAAGRRGTCVRACAHRYTYMRDSSLRKKPFFSADEGSQETCRPDHVLKLFSLPLPTD